MGTVVLVIGHLDLGNFKKCILLAVFFPWVNVLHNKMKHKTTPSEKRQLFLEIEDFNETPSLTKKVDLILDTS